MDNRTQNLINQINKELMWIFSYELREYYLFGFCTRMEAIRLLTEIGYSYDRIMLWFTPLDYFEKHFVRRNYGRKI